MEIEKVDIRNKVPGEIDKRQNKYSNAGIIEKYIGKNLRFIKMEKTL